MAPQRTRTYALASAAAAAIAAVLVIALGAGDQPGAEPGQPVSARLEFFDGSTGDLADLAGTPVVLNFWASWCPACVAEMADFGDVHREFGDRVVFLGLNMQEISVDAALRLIDETGVEYRMVHDRDGALYRMFGGIAMPTTVFIDAHGSVVRVHGGVLFEDDLRRIIESELLG
ncbi:MAG: TlpA disulfide reductase family protein [Acidimicrobiia bacterium]